MDPMLSPARAMEPVANAGNDLRIPLVDLPFGERELQELLGTVDGVLVTLNHRDHWDATARDLLRKDLPILCQAGDEVAIAGAGVSRVTPVVDDQEWNGITVHRTEGRHGTGEIGERMGHVSGFVLMAEKEPSLYIAGDTIWCPEVARALDTFRPDVVVVNAGQAQYVTGDPITMSAADVAAVCRALPSAQVVAVHMEAINHCRLTRAALRASLAGQGLLSRVRIPADGERIGW